MPDAPWRHHARCRFPRVQALAVRRLPVPLAVPLVMRVRVGSRQLQVLRLLYTHRLLTAVQVRALAFETATRRTCEICLQRLHRKDWVVRAEPLHGGAGGGRSGYVYGLSAQGGDVLSTLAGIPLADIPTVAGPEALEARYVNHQLAVNGCLLAIRQASRAHPRAALQEWTADPHARVRYQVGRSWRTVHPDAIAEIEVDGRCRWMYLEVDRGTAELRRYGLKLRRYARFYLSGSWRREYATFPEIRIVTAHRPRVRRMLAEVEDTVRSFSRTEHDTLVANVVVAVTWESVFLADPAAAVWSCIFAGDRREPLLANGDAKSRIGADTSEPRGQPATCRGAQNLGD